MALHLVGLNIAGPSAKYRAAHGRLVQLMRGVYIDSDDNADALVLRNAVRIAHYLYPKAYLSAASAILLTPTPEGKLFLSSRRNQRTRLRALEIVQNTAPDNPAVASATIVDDFGDLTIDVSSLRQRFLESFRVRSEHATAVTDPMKQDLVTRLIAEYGSPKGAADAVWALARENSWYKEAEVAERWLLRQQPISVAHTEQNVDLHVAWHGVPIGKLRHDGFEWRWTAAKVNMPMIVRDTTPGKLPPFIAGLLPEGWLDRVLPGRDERDILLSGRRYMSNVAIVNDLANLAVIHADFLTSPLRKWTKRGLFTGQYLGPGRNQITDSFETQVAKLYQDADTPRLSGVQIKAPMHLSSKGELVEATGRSFTHILKPGGTGGFETLPVVEWFCLDLARRVGFNVPSFALVTMPEGLPPALLVERFDIRTKPQSGTLYCLEDFCSLLDVGSEAKYEATIERVARALRPISTDPEQDLLALFRRALFAWLVADGDMHLKNMALLKTAEAGDTAFRVIAMAPIYDVVTTRVFPTLKHDRMALKLNGKDDRLRRTDFTTLGRTIGLSAERANQAIDMLAASALLRVGRVKIPAIGGLSDTNHRQLEAIQNFVRERATAFQPFSTLAKTDSRVDSN
jgi:serine/threonine-protein kinase HipA